MKIRQGFVSNSSSSSFIALGFSIEGESKPYRDILVALGQTEEALDAIIQKEKTRYTDEDWSYEEDELIREALHDEIYNLGKEEHIRILYGSEDGVPEDDRIVALILMETDSYDGGYFSQGEVIMDERDEDYSKIAELRDKVSPDEEIRVIYGTRCC
jgi:hypothetical protein